MKFLINIIIFSFLTASSFAQEKTLTEKNLLGQKYLYEHGWFVVPSATESLKYFNEHALEKSPQAMARALRNIKNSPTHLKAYSEYKKSAAVVKENFKLDSKKLSQEFEDAADSFDKVSLGLTKQLKDSAYQRLVIGYVEFEARTVNERNHLKSFFGNYVTDLKKSTEVVGEGFDQIAELLLPQAETGWRKHFSEAKDVFNQQYEKSGTRSNSIAGLYDILVGYVKTMFHGIIKPSVSESKYIIQKTIFYVAKGTFYSVIGSGSVVYSTGANFYKLAKMGYKLISPSIESGFLASLSLLTYTAGKGVNYALKGGGTITKLAIEGTGAVAAPGKVIIDTTIDGAKTAAVYVYEFGVGATEAIYEQVDGAVVLSYSALTQLPPQLLLGAINSTFFLVYDGPKIILAKVKNDEVIKNLPTGTVLDAKKLKEEGYELVPAEIDDETKLKILKNSK